MSNTHSIFGFHAITSRLRQNPDSVQEIFLDSTRRDQRVRDLTKLAETQGVRIILCDEKDWSRCPEAIFIRAWLQI